MHYICISQKNEYTGTAYLNFARIQKGFGENNAFEPREYRYTITVM